MITRRQAADSLGTGGERAWDDIRAAADIHGGFWLGFVFGAQTHEVAEFVARSRDKARPRGLQVEVVPVSDDLTATMHALLTRRPNLALTWVVDEVSDPIERTATWQRMLMRLNQNRDKLSRARPSGLVVCCPAEVEALVRDTAPDLWSVRSLTTTTNDHAEDPHADAYRTQPLRPLTDAEIQLDPGTARPTYELRGGDDAATWSRAPDRTSILRPRRRRGTTRRPQQAGQSPQVVALLRNAATALGGGRAEAAVAAAREALDLAVTVDDTAAAHGWLARALAASGDITEAVEHALAALRSGGEFGPESRSALLGIVVESSDPQVALDAAAALVEQRQADVSATPDAPETVRDLSAALSRLADLAQAAGQQAEALSASREAVDLARRGGDSPADDDRLAAALTRVGDLLSEDGAATTALHSYTEALALRRRLVSSSAGSAAALRDLADSLVKVGVAQQAVGRLDDARACLVEAIGIARQAEPEPDALRETARLLVRLGDVQRARGDLDDALAHYSEALELRRGVRDATGDTAQSLREIAISLNRLGDTERERENLDNALRHNTDALAFSVRAREIAGDTRQALRDLAIALNRLGDTERARGDLDAALGHHTEAMVLSRRILDESGGSSDARRDLAITLRRIGDAQRASRRHDDALAAYTDALAAHRRVEAETGETTRTLRDMQRVLTQLGETQRARGSLDEAIAHLTEALQLTRRIRDDHGETPRALRDVMLALTRLGDARRAHGDLAEALDLLQEALGLAQRIRDDYGESPTALRDLCATAMAAAAASEEHGDETAALALYWVARVADTRLEYLFGPPFWDPEMSAELTVAIEDLS